MQISSKNVWKAVGLAAAVWLGIKFFLAPFLPFLAGWLLALWLEPLVSRLERKSNIKRGVWAVVLTGGTVFLFLFFVCRFGSLLLIQAKDFVRELGSLGDLCSRFFDGCCDRVEELTGISGEETRRFLTVQMTGLKKNFVEKVVPSAFEKVCSCMKDVAFLASGFVIALLSAFFFVRDLPVIRKRMEVFPAYRSLCRIAVRLQQTGLAYLKAQLIIMVVIAAICSLGFFLMKSPWYLFLGISIGLLDALPLIGTGLFLFPAAIFFLLGGEGWMAVGCIVLEILTSFAREFLEPRLLGAGTGIYPVVIMAAVYAGLFFFGAPGVVLGPVFLLLVYAIGQEQRLWK